MVAVKRRRSGRIVRRRRFSKRTRVRRRRFGRKRYGARRRSCRIPMCGKRELSYIVNTSQLGSGDLAEPLDENVWYLCRIPNVKPYPAFSEMFKMYRLVKLLVAVRRRNPQPVVYNQAAGGNTVNASRVQTNNIWWCPWGKYDAPTQPPRQIRSAVLLSDRWTVRKISQKVVKLNWIFAPDGGLATFSGQWHLPEYTNAPDFIGSDPAGTGTNAFMKKGTYIFNDWTRWPWLGFNSGSVWPITLGFFLTENFSAVEPDLLEVCVRACFRFRGRKTLGSYEDKTGAFDAVPMLDQVPLDKLGTVPKSLDPK